MAFDIETSHPEQNYHDYTEGGTAFLNTVPRVAPHQNNESAEAIAWYRGYDDMELLKKQKGQI